MRRYVIIGSGAAGIAASEAIRNHDASGEILLITDDPHGYYSRPGLAYYLTGEIDERMLFPFSEQDFRRLNLRRITAQVARIHPEAHRIEMHTGAQLPYDRLLIATGAAAVRADVPGSDLAGVVKLDSLEDTRHILNLIRRARSAVVVGGGITALELVEGMRARNLRTHYFLRGDRYWSNVLDAAESKIVEHRLQEEGVQIHYNTELAEILGKNGRVAGVRTKDGRLIECQIVAIAIGVQPRKQLAQTSDLKVDKGILVDQYMRTSHEDIFAAGDVAQVYDPLSGKSVVDSLWGPARDQGSAAGLNMAGITTPYSRLAPFNVTRLAHLTTTIIGTVNKGRDDDLLGIARGDSETWRNLPDAIAAQANFDVNSLRLLLGKQHLLGAVVMGDQTLSRPLTRIVIERVDITPIREQILQPGAPLGDLVADFWSQLHKS